MEKWKADLIRMAD